MEKNTAEYKTPRIEDYGNLAELTAGTNKANPVASPDTVVGLSMP